MGATEKKRGSRPLRRRFEAFFDVIGVHPMPLLVFLLSVAAFLFLAKISNRAYEAPAVASAPAVEHPATTATFVEVVHVHSGDTVDEGAPIATLSAQFLEQELRLIDREIDRIRSQAEWEQARLRDADGERRRELQAVSADAQRELDLADVRSDESATRQDLAEDRVEQTRDQVDRRLAQVDALQDAEYELGQERALARRESRQVRIERQHNERVQALIDEIAAGGTLEEPALQYYNSELSVLFAQRDAVLDGMQNLTIRARSSGRVSAVLPEGSSVADQTSVATIVSNEPDEVIAYLPPDKFPEMVVVGSEVSVRTLELVCPEPAQVLRRGAAVVEAPGQLRGTFGAPLFGTPLHLSVPRGCPIGVGQTLLVDLSTAVR